MGGVDQRAEALALEKRGEAERSAEATDAVRRGRELQVRGTTGEREQKLEARIGGQAIGQKPRLGRPAEN